MWAAQSITVDTRTVLSYCGYMDKSEHAAIEAIEELQSKVRLMAARAEAADDSSLLPPDDPLMGELIDVNWQLREALVLEAERADALQTDLDEAVDMLRRLAA